MRNSASHLLSHVIAFSSVQMPLSSKYKTTIRFIFHMQEILFPSVQDSSAMTDFVFLCMRKDT